MHLTNIRESYAQKINKSTEIFNKHLHIVQLENETIAKQKEEQSIKKFEKFVLKNE